MIDNRNIPDAGKSWQDAEKILDRHFRNVKIFRASLFVAATAVLVGLALLWNNREKDLVKATYPFDNKGTPVVNESATAIEQSTLASEEKYNNRPLAKSEKHEKGELPSFSNNKVPVVNSTAVIDVKKTGPSGSAEILKTNSGNSFANHGDKTNNEIKLNNSTSTTSEGQSVSATKGSKLMASRVVSTNSKIPKSSKSAKQSSLTEVASQNAVSLQDGSRINSRDLNEPVASMDQIALLAYQTPALEIHDTPFGTSQRSWPKPYQPKHDRHISLELAVYGGAHLAAKSIKADNEWINYLNHRSNEEKGVVTPVFGFSLSAARNSFSLSIGAEYSSYSEKTNYYPYSIQPSYVNTSGWRSFVVQVADTDTAYITGNPWLFEILTQRQDSVFIIDQDTLEEYKYDRMIAEKNGVNRLTYVEVPLEVSVYFTRGRMGIGVSGGISPGLLISQKGNYLKRDGRGVESFSEIQTFRKLIFNARFSADVYYRFNARTKLLLRPQLKSNLNSVFEKSYGVNQKYYSTGVLFGISYMLN